jgi:exodeoxyribonuclease-3
MKIVSWNVNGIRACLGKGLESSLAGLGADFYCLQETKANPDQVPLIPHPFLAKQNTAWASAEKKGYSGTAIFTPHKDADLSNSMGIPKYDQEGRTTIARFSKFTLVNLYIPNGAASDERHNFKMQYLKDLLVWLKALEKTNPLVICGDYNIAHTEIDIHDPVRNKDSSGFRPEERKWFTEFLNAGFVDSFRHMHPNRKDAYSWWSFRQASRERNKGWRIDYVCVSESLKKNIHAAEIHDHIHGSDHCPVILELQL